MGIRAATGAVSALLITGALSACGSSNSSSSNGVASKSPDAIVSAASGAIAGVKSVHVTGSTTSAGLPLTLDLSLVSGQGGRGSMAENGLSFQIVAVGQSVYIQGTPAFWRHFGGSAAAGLLAGKWLKAPATGQFAAISSLTNIQQLFSKLLLTHGKLAKGGTSTVNGQQVVAVTDTTKGGTLYVAATGQPYPVEVAKSGTGGGRITFDRFNQPVSLAAPKNVIDIAQLG